MKRLLVRILTVSACLHGLAWHAVDQRHQQEVSHPPRNGYEMVAAFSPEMAQSVPESFAKAPIKDLKFSKNKLFFTIKGFPMFVEWIGKPGRLMKFNNRLFIEKDFASEETYRKAFFAKFGIRHSAMASFMPRGFASIDDNVFGETTTTTSNNNNENSQADGTITNHRLLNGNVYEGLNYDQRFSRYMNSPELFTDEALLGHTQTGEMFRAMVEGTTGDSMLAMVKYAALFQGSLAYAMNPAGGFTPGFGLMNNPGGVNLSNIPLPHASQRN